LYVIMKVEIHSCGNKFFIIESNFIYFNLNVPSTGSAASAALIAESGDGNLT